ncbi:MAG: HlyD family efflux transporter periplasmic adaptor subunit [Owenweeksia sp.]|nr:HlyD family efflux transporter periplasmic adaptor subunit [Owenweeksia sp.]
MGQYTGTAKPLFTIVSKDHLHLELQVPPSKIDLVKVGDPIRFTTGTSKQVMRGEVYLVNQVADELGFFNVHAHFRDSHKNLRPGIFAEVSLIYHTDTLPALPLTAIFEEHNKQSALVVENDEFVHIPVATGVRSDSLISILNPDKLRGKTVVMNGVKYLLGKEAEGGHSH